VRNRHPSLVRALAAAGIFVAGCAPPPAPPKPPAPRSTVIAPAPTPVPAPPERESPPEAGAARELSLPAPRWAEMSNGLKVATLVSPALPIVQIRVVALGGKASDGEKPGLSVLTGELLKEGGAADMSGRELVERVESLGATLDISTTFDRTTVSLGVTKDQLGEALSLVSAVVKRPTMSPNELGKLKKRMSDEAADRARTDGAWGASMMLYKALYRSGGALHPYSVFDATAADIGKITAGDCRAHHRRTMVPKNMFVVVAGDVDHDEVKAAVEKALGDLPGGEPQVISYPAPTVPPGLTITLVDRPRSTQSQVMVGVLGPERTSASWPAFATANQILGGGVAGRLFTEVREKASLAYTANSSVTELGHGPSVLAAYAATQSNKTGLTVKALLDQVERLGTTEPTAGEVAVATRFLADVTAIRLETVGALANELVRSRTLGLPDDASALFRRQVREVNTAAVAKATSERVRGAAVAVVVAGDAKIVGPMLSHFGDVKIVDPVNGFVEKETLSKNPDSALELPEEAGK
jgi:zinc protease